MKILLICLSFLLACKLAFAQNDFTGIVKYRMTVEGSSNAVTDSMLIVFGKQKIKIVLYLPAVKDSAVVSEKIFIDDFAAKKSMTLNTETNTYKIDTLNKEANFNFVNTNKITASDNNLLCFIYKADSAKLYRSLISSAVCLASIDHRNSIINNYFFLGVQPVIVDNRIVMDFITTRIDGSKPKTYVSEIKKLDDVENYFKLDGFKLMH